MAIILPVLFATTNQN